jgi:hypothetical protein
MDYQHIIENITYKPQWTFTYGEKHGHPWLYITAAVPHATTGKPVKFRMQRIIPANLIHEEPIPFMEWVKLLIIEAELHEVDEFLRYGGVLLSDPHATFTET